MLNKLLILYTKYFVIWVTIFGIFAYYFPNVFIGLRNYMDWFFALTMFGIGAVLDIEDFKKIVQKPVIILIGTAAQFLIMPFGAFFVAKIFRLPPEIAIGLILTGSAPGAMASNVMSYIAKADTAYSVSLTTVSTLLAPVLTPGLTYMLANSILRVDFWSMFFNMLKIVIVPLFIGVGIKYFYKDKVMKIAGIFPAISVTFIIFICSLVIALNKTYLAMMTGMVLLSVLVLNLYGMIMGYGVGGIFRLGQRRQRTLSLEIGMQNAGLGTVLALKHFGERSAMPAALFVFICIFWASIMAEIWQKSGNQNI